MLDQLEKDLDIAGTPTCQGRTQARIEQTKHLVGSTQHTQQHLIRNVLRIEFNNFSTLTLRHMLCHVSKFMRSAS